MSERARKFPLYDELRTEDIRDECVQGEEWSKLCQALSACSAKHAELVYLIVYHHYREHEKKVPKSLTSGGRGIVIVAEKLPLELKKKLCAFARAIRAGV